MSAGLTTPEEIWRDRSIHYLASSLSLDVARHYYYFGKLGVGVDFFYDASIAEKMRYYKIQTEFSDLNFWGFHVSHELMVNRFALVTQVGVTLTKRELEGKWWGRFGLRIDLARNVFIRGTLKIPDGFKADFIEWGVGFNFYSPNILKRYSL
jgi:hypothetical protein